MATDMPDLPPDTLYAIGTVANGIGQWVRVVRERAAVADQTQAPTRPNDESEAA